MPVPSAPAISRARAASCALVNLAATPGLGSLMAGRWVAGGGQLALAVAGFVMVATWFVEVMIQFYGLMAADARTELNYRFLKVGAILFAAAWLWSLVTSLSLLRQKRSDERAEQKPVPPRLADLAGKPPEQL
jgi:hypothetical protein